MTVIVRKSGVQSSGQSDQISFGQIFPATGPFSLSEITIKCISERGQGRLLSASVLMLGGLGGGHDIEAMARRRGEL
jgi:hypothetical protein